MEILKNLERCKNTGKDFKLLILDYHLPYLSGLDVVEQCKEVYSKEQIPFPSVLILTAIEDPRLKKACLAQKRVDYFLTKPAKSEELSSILS